MTISRFNLALSASALALVCAGAAQARSASSEEIIVTATRGDKGVPRGQLGSSVSVLSPVDLGLRQTRTVSDILRDVPGVSVSRLGAVGGATNIRMRGSEGNHTLVLIDGMEASDPFYGEFDFATLIADDVARIEVLRGQQSALYGSDAIGGVINYLTVSGAEAPGVRGRIEGGSFGSYGGAARIAGADDRLDYAFSAAYQSTDGTPTSRFGTRHVGAESGAVSGRVVYEAAPHLRLRALARYATTEADVNPQDYDYMSPTNGYVIDGEGYYRNEALYGLVSGELDLLDGAWTHEATVQGMQGWRDGYDDTLDYANEGERLKASYVTAYHFGSDEVRHTLTAAADWKRERFQNTGPGLLPEQGQLREIENTGLVAQYDILVGKSFGAGAAIRHDQNDRFENATTYRLQASYALDFGLRVHAAGGSGIKNPSMTELFGYDPANYIGNPDLKPERSEGWEAGLEQSFLDGRVRIDATYFDSRLKNEIYTDYSDYPRATPGNRDTTSTQHGVEVSAQALIGDSWRAFASWTWIDAEENGMEEVRRPSHIGSFNLSYIDVDDRFSATLTVRYNGETDDNNFTNAGGPRVRLSSYTLVNLGGDVRLTDELRLFARVENLFDADYEDVYTYRTPGRAFHAGLKAGF